MSIIIKGMKMPIVCDDCWALDECGDYPMCRITQEQRGYNFNTREYRMDDCPLVEIPTPHGRLVEEHYPGELKAKSAEGIYILFRSADEDADRFILEEEK